MAGINAVLSLRGEEPLILRRDEAYIGVLIDDLVTKGTSEPYRMFTSRAEYRLLLREESADIRLSEYGYKLGLISSEAYMNMIVKRTQIDDGFELLKNIIYTPNKEFIAQLEEMGEEKITDKLSAAQLVARKTFTKEKMLKLVPQLTNFSDYIQDEIMVEAKYEHYIKKQLHEIERMKKNINIKIPEGFDFASVSGLSKEIVEKLNRFNPPTLQAASQISGITPAAIDIMHIHIKISKREK
jgi:tRNA uridine 5-carboxymethylaminomethyl modification enzyme